MPFSIFNAVKKLPLSHPDLSNGLKLTAATVGAAALKPLTFHWAYKREGFFNDQERKLLISQEMVRQIVSSTLYLGTQLGCWALSRKVFPKQKELNHFANAFLGSSIIDIFARPFLMAKVSKVFPTSSFRTATHTPEALKFNESKPVELSVKKASSISTPTYAPRFQRRNAYINPSYSNYGYMAYPPTGMLRV